MTIDRRAVFTIALGGAAMVASGQRAVAQTFPQRPIRMVVPFPPGGPTDIVARPLATLLGEAIGTNVIIDNRGGVGGALGADIVSKAPPDGYTLVVGTVGTHAINGALYKTLPYDAVRDFTPITLVASAPVAVVAHPSQPFADLSSLVSLAKASPGKLNYGSAGNGTPGHLAGEMFKAAAGIDIQHVPYKGSAPAVSDLLAGNLQIMFDPLQSVISFVQSGAVRAIAVSSAQRSSILMNVPTVAEQGYANFELTAWWGVFAPARLDADIRATLATAIGKVVGGNEFRNKVEPLGIRSTVLPDMAFLEFQQREIAKWGKVVRDAGISLQ